MDLGFGNANQVMGDATAQALLQSTRVQEEAIADSMARYDALLEAKDDTLEDLRERRLAQLKQKQAQNQQWRQQGHGVYASLQDGQQDSRDVARAFFEASKQSERLVVHFYRPTTRYCDVFHAHLEKLAPQHLETRFCKINVEGCDEGNGGGASYLVEKLGIVVMPTLVIIQNRKAIHHVRGFDELGGRSDFSTQALAFVLGLHGGLICQEHEQAAAEEELKENHVGGYNVNAIRISKGYHKKNNNKGIRGGVYDEDFDEE